MGVRPVLAALNARCLASMAALLEGGTVQPAQMLHTDLVQDLVAEAWKEPSGPPGSATPAQAPVALELRKALIAAHLSEKGEDKPPTTLLAHARAPGGGGGGGGGEGGERPGGAAGGAAARAPRSVSAAGIDASLFRSSQSRASQRHDQQRRSALAASNLAEVTGQPVTPNFQTLNPKP